MGLGPLFLLLLPLLHDRIYCRAIIGIQTPWKIEHRMHSSGSFYLSINFVITKKYIYNLVRLIICSLSMWCYYHYIVFIKQNMSLQMPIMSCTRIFDCRNDISLFIFDLICSQLFELMSMIKINVTPFIRYRERELKFGAKNIGATFLHSILQ